MTNENSNLNEDSGTQPGPNKKRNISSRDAELLDQATHANATWKDHPDITLNWMSQAEFETLIATTRLNYEERVNTSGGRKAISARLVTLDKEIDDSVAIVKAYLAAKYESAIEAQNHYPKFGIIKKKSYQFPGDRNQRIQSLKQMLKGLVAEGFGAEKFGTAYWTAISNEYKSLFTEAGEVDGSVSHRVGAKSGQVQTIRRVLKSLTFLLKAHYPDTWKNELRLWGFQKEKL